MFRCTLGKYHAYVWVSVTHNSEKLRIATVAWGHDEVGDSRDDLYLSMFTRIVTDLGYISSINCP